MVELRALGSIDLRRDGTEISTVLTQPKRLALLFYLDLARPRGFHRRDRLVSLLWPKLDDTHSRDELSEAIQHIRKELGENAIVTRGEEVMLDPVYIRSDARVLDAAIANEDHMRAVQLYQGSLADGLHVEDAPDFERWLSDERDRLRDSIATAAWVLAEKSKQSGRIVDATMFARSAANLTRDDESSVRKLMVFLENAGDRAGALRAYDEFALWLSAEFDENPAPDTEALRNTIRNSGAVSLTPTEPIPAIPEPVLMVAPVTPATPVASVEGVVVPEEKKSFWRRYAVYEAAVFVLVVFVLMATWSASK